MALDQLDDIGRGWVRVSLLASRAIFAEMKLFLIPGKLEHSKDLPFRVYLVAAPSDEKAFEFLPAGFQLGGGWGEAEGSIDHPEGIIARLGSRTAISVDGRS